MIPLSAVRSTLTRLGSRGQVQSELDPTMLPYTSRVKQEEEQKQKRIQPLQMIFDVLSRGQYLTANIADEIEESFRTGRPLGESTVQVLKAAFEGVTGNRKGDWETLLFGGKIGGESEQAGERAGWIPQDVQEKLEQPLIKYGKEGATGLAEGILRPSKWIGLGANVLLDPTTYISFGATSVAKNAASKYADDVVKLTLATMGPDDLAKFGLTMADKAKSNYSKLAEKIVKTGSERAKREISKIYDDAYKFALRNTPEKLTKELAPRLDLAKNPIGRIKQGSEYVDEVAPSGGVQKLIDEIGGYAGAGQRKTGTFFGKEFGVSERYPDALKWWDDMGKKLSETKVGGRLGDAWWSVMNRGPIGSIRKALGIRNPYQQMLHLQQRGRETATIARGEQEALKLRQVFQKYDDEIIQKHRALRMEAGDTGTTVEALAKKYTDLNVMGPGRVGLHDVTPEDVQKIVDLDAQLSEITGQWYREAEKKALETGQQFDVTEMAEYFPQQVGRGKVKSGTMRATGPGTTGSQGFTKSKTMKVGDHVENNAQMFEYLMGDQLKAAYDALPPDVRGGDFHEWVKQWVVDKNMSETTLDLEEALMLRGVAHAKYLGRLDAISDLRQYGIPMADAMNVLPRGMDKVVATYGSGTSNMGLYKVDVPGFEDMLFDEDVAETITNAGAILASDKSLQEFAGTLGKVTAWWKTWVTANPGFHARNAMSNNITGFLKHGARWVNPEKHLQAAAITAYALHPDKYVDLLKNELKDFAGMKWTDANIARVLNGQVMDGMTGKELGDYIRSTGLVSKHSQVSEEIGKEVNKGLTALVGRASRTAGDAIEGQSKVMSFLLDYEDLTKGMQRSGDFVAGLASRKQALEYANQEAKKWFLDYGDLTPAEKQLKKVIPFFSWIRKNLANQIAGLTLQTNMYSLIPKARGAMTNDDDFDYSLMPDYMENMGYYPVGQTAEGGSVLRWANLPIEDVNKIPLTFGPGILGKNTPRLAFQETLNDVVASAHPLIKSFIEMASGKDLFRQRDIKDKEKAPGVMQYLNNSPKVVAALDGMLRLAGFGAGLSLDRQQGQLVMDGRIVKLLDTNIPQLRILDNMINNPQVVGEILFPGTEELIEKLTGKKDSVTALNEVFNIISRTAGWKFREIQMDEEEQRKEAAMLKKAEALRSEDRKKLPGYQVRSAKALQARQKRAARYF